MHIIKGPICDTEHNDTQYETTYLWHSVMTISINDTQLKKPFIECHEAECRNIKCPFVLIAVLKVVMLSVIMLNVVMLSAVALFAYLHLCSMNNAFANEIV